MSRKQLFITLGVMCELKPFLTLLFKSQLMLLFGSLMLAFVALIYGFIEEQMTENLDSALGFSLQGGRELSLIPFQIT